MVFTTPIDEIGAAWNREAIVGIAVMQEERRTVLLGDVIGSDKGSLELQVNQFVKNSNLLKEFYDKYAFDRFVVSFDLLTQELLAHLTELSIKPLYMNELLELTDTRVKLPEAIRTKSPRIRRTVPIAIPFVEETVKVEKTSI